MHSPRSKSQTGDVSLSGENVGIVDTFIDGACSFTAQLSWIFPASPPALAGPQIWHTPVIHE